MVLVLQDVLTVAEAAAVQESVCGRLGQAGSSPGEEVDEALAAASQMVSAALESHPHFTMAVQPRVLSQMRFRCREAAVGRVEGEDVPDRGKVPARADLVVTLFLSDPASYDGGELIIDTGYGGEGYRGQAGACIVCPISARRSMGAVTRGRQLTGDLLVESDIGDERKRAIVYDVSCAELYLEIFAAGRHQDLARLRRCREELLRLWAGRHED